MTENPTTNLILAVQDGTAELVKDALAAGGKVNERDESGTDALHYAEFRGDPDILLLLLQSGQVSTKTIHEEIEYLEYLIDAYPDLDHSKILKIAHLFNQVLRLRLKESLYLN